MQYTAFDNFEGLWEMLESNPVVSPLGTVVLWN